MLGLVFEKDFRNTFNNQWAALENYLSDQGFAAKEQSSRVEILNDLELNSSKKNEEAKMGFTELKQQMIAYYLNTEEIGTNYLNHLPIPGEYEPCISLEDVNNKAWAE